MIKQKILAVLTSLCIGVLPLAAGMAAAPVAAEDTTEPVRILAMGDSITDGYINGDNGYRKYFCYEMQQKGFTNFDMVGPKNNWSDSVSYTTSDGVTFQYDPAHAGYSGYAIEKIGSRQGLYETIFDTTYYNNNVTGNMIEAYDPDIVLLQIGTNDLLDNQNAGITDRLEKLVDKLLDSIDNNSMLFVASVPDIDVSVRHDWLWAYQSSGYSYENNPEEFTALVEQSVDNYNASVKELVEKKQAAGARIRFADINSVVDMKTGLKDGVHPNEAGYACMGKYWSEQVSAYLNGTTPTPTPATTTEVTTATETTTTAIETTTTSTEATTETTVSTTTEATTTSTETFATESSKEITTEMTTASSSVSESDTTTSTTETSAQPTWQKGDVTLDGTVNIADAVRLCRYLLGSETISQQAYQCADVYTDSMVNGFDLAALRQMLTNAGGQNQ